MKKTFSGWLRLIRFPEIFSVPGDVIALFLLTGGQVHWKLFVLAAAGIFAFIAGAVLNALADMEKDCAKHTDYPLPSGAVSPRVAVAAAVVSALLALACAAQGLLTLVVCIALLVCVWRYDFAEKPFYLAAARFLCAGLGIAGAVQSSSVQIPWSVLAVSAVFACGLLIFHWGIALAVQTWDEIRSERPGRYLVLTGAVIAYAVLFALMIVKPTDSWFLLACGAVSALSAAVFAILAYWAFRMFFFPTVPGQMRGFASALWSGCIFIQAAAVAACGNLWIAAALLSAAAASHFSARYLMK